MMEVYAYTLSFKGQQPLKGLGTIDDISTLLKRMKLLTEHPFEAIITNPTSIEWESNAKTYIYAEGEKDEWRLRWVRFI